MLVWLAGSAGQEDIQPHAMGWEKCPHTNEYRDMAISLQALWIRTICLHNTCCNGPSACIAEILPQDEHPEQGDHIFPVITVFLFEGSGRSYYFSKEHLVITTLRIYAQSSSVLNSVMLSSHGSQQRHMPFFGQEETRWAGDNSAEDSSTFPGKDK